MNDEHAMERAIALGLKARVHAPPNPWVGCVVVKDGEIVGEGFTAKAGGEHAEVSALKSAGKNAAGATLYVSLEPCSHHGKNPPCAQAIIESGIAKVVIAVEDPDPNVHGKGIEALKKAGIEVIVGVLEEKATASLAPYLHHRKTGRAFCVAKAAMSIDGCLAAADGSSQWITGEEARLDVHRQRAESQAIVIGSGTAIKDDPLLTVRGVELPPTPPLRVILDSKGVVPDSLQLFTNKDAPTHVMTEPKKNGHINLKAVLETLGKRGIIQAFFEGGPSLMSALMEEGLIDLLSIYVGPKVLGNSPHKLFSGLEIPAIAEAKPLRLIGVRKLGNSVRLDYVFG